MWSVGSRVATVLAFLEATESTCRETDVVAARCKTAMATIDELLLECADLTLLFAQLDCCVTHVSKMVVAD